MRSLICRIIGHRWAYRVLVSFDLYAFGCGRCGEQTFTKAGK